jgi:[protein-PII] uridylyltransferase
LKTVKELEFEIENLFEEKDSLLKIGGAIRTHLKEYEKFVKSANDNSKGFVFRHTRFYDAIISLVYKTVLRDVFRNFLPMRNSVPISLVALGSYGREEMTLHSDIDLMIAYRDIEGYNIEKIIEKFLHMLWDSGIKLGHRVHKIVELQQVAETDITIKTALIESRQIIGSAFVWGSVVEELNRVREKNQKEYLIAKCMETSKRHEKERWDNMTPNLKEGVGGLRDANFLFWTLNTIYRIDKTSELANEFFSEDEYKKFSQSLDFIFSVRSALHKNNRRKRDRIFLEDTPNLANQFTNGDQSLFLKKLLQNMRELHLFSMKYVRKEIFQKFIDYSDRDEVSIINDKLEFVENKHFNSINLFLQTLEPFENFKIGNSLFSISIDTQQEVSKIAVKKLLKRENLYPVLELLWKFGILEKVLPPFEKVMFLPQFDGYHNHTVDIHSIYNIRELENISDPFLLEIYKNLSKKDLEILKIASLFHDIGKGRNEEHSRVGGKVAKQFLQNLDYSTDIIEDVVILIRHHTLMTSIAYHEDIHNEKVIYSFVSKIPSERLLKLLYLLTYADVKSVNDKTYNSYNRTLLRTLYESANLVIGDMDLIKESAKREKVEKQIRNLAEFSEIPKLLQKAISRIKSNQLFFQKTATDILEIITTAREVENYHYEIANDNFFTFKAIRKSEVNFDIAYFLSKVDFLSVVSLQVFELFDGIKYFQIDFVEKLEDEDLPFVEFSLKDAFSDKERRYKDFSTKISSDEVEINCDYSNTFAQISIKTENQNGLLAYLFRVFEENGVRVVSSKIQTFKKRVRDTFLVEKCDCEKIENLKHAIILAKK